MPSRRRDVELLHEIITTAQQSPHVDNLPFRAIFGAYDQVLARHGLDPDHDQVYLRFLFKLGDKREVGQSLYESFEALLLDLGIQILFGDEEDASQDHGAGNISIQGHVEAEHSGVSRGRSRRASFSSFIDAGEENTRASRIRPDSRASLSRLQIGRPSTRATTRPRENVQPRDARSRTGRAPPLRGRLTSSEFANNLQHYRRRHASASTQGDGHEYHQIINRSRDEGNRDGHVRDAQSPLVQDSQGSGGLDETASSLRSQEFRDLGFELPQEVLYRPSDTQLVRDAGTFEHFRTRAVANNAFRQWRELAVNAYHDHHDMEERAIAHDAGILERQAFDQWRNLFLERKRMAETERFFSHQERKAGRARDLYLLTKAFTHWAQCTSEEVERTSVARRHILRTRYFNAWLEITAVNNLKVRRQRLGKFFSLWQQGLESTRAGNTRAVAIYCNNLVEAIYWRWFWNFCERRAPEWRNARLKRQYFAQWILTHRVDAESTVWATVSQEEKLKKRYFGRWVAKTRITQLGQQRAEQHYQGKLISRSALQWRQRLQFLPKTRRVEGMVNWRIVSSAFTTLVDRFRLEKQAEQVNRERLVRNAWTQWNDRLRAETLTHQINDRLTVQALYKWVLAERSVLLRRLHEERLERRTLMKLVDHWKSLTSSHLATCQTLTRTRNQKLLRSVFSQFQSHLDMHRRNARLAHEFHAPKATSDTLHLWTAKLAHTRQLHTMARDASFYFRCTRTLQRCRTAVTESHAQKRRTAYATIRRMTKMNLARRLLQNWHGRTTHTTTLHRYAEEIVHQRDMHFATSLFDRWRDRLAFVLAAQESARQSFAGELAHQYLQRWLARSRAHRDADAQAVDFAASHVQRSAYEALRSLQLTVFEHRSRAQTAAEMRAWNQRRQFRACWRAWLEKTLARRGGAAAGPSMEFARSFLGRRAGRTPAATRWGPGGMGGLGVDGGEVDNDGEDGRETDGGARALGRRGSDDGPDADDNNDNVFDLGDWIPALQAPNTATPLPGYLSTPSKRAARARALVGAHAGMGGGGSGAIEAGSTTPATPRTPRARLPARTPLTRQVPAYEGGAANMAGGAVGTTPFAGRSEEVSGPGSALRRSNVGGGARVGFADRAEGEGEGEGGV